MTRTKNNLFLLKYFLSPKNERTVLLGLAWWAPLSLQVGVADVSQTGLSKWFRVLGKYSHSEKQVCAAAAQRPRAVSLSFPLPNAVGQHDEISQSAGFVDPNFISWRFWINLCSLLQFQENHVFKNLTTSGTINIPKLMSTCTEV